LLEHISNTIVWRGNVAVSEVRCTAGVLAEIAELALSGYRRYPWGGVEIGGVLFGKNDSGAVRICSMRPAECEHHYGPSFELSAKDCEAFGNLLTLAESDAELAGLTPVGWFQSASRRDLGLSDSARAFFHRFFPDPRQVAMLIVRSKRDPLSVAFFVHGSQGAVELHSPAQEFTLESLRQRQETPSAPE
jgi:hypothetical protein